MTIPARPVRPVRSDRRFDLRATALFFLLLAISLCLLAFLVHTAVGVVERRPWWAAALAVLGVAAALMSRRRWRTVSAARGARRAARALEQAAETASDSLRRTAVGEVEAPAARIGASREPCPGGACAGTGRDETCTGLAAPRATTAPLGPDDVQDPVAPGHAAGFDELDPDGFEQAVADLCARDGCRAVQVVGGAGDLGADIVATTTEGRRVVVQCKQYSDAHKVGSQDMQRFGGTCFTIHEADIAVLVTTSDFTAPALEYARQCGIVCMNGRDLEAWRRGTGPSPWQPGSPLR
ncbi:restriction endonuclease [Streptomyces sp. NPDC046759]|uniref:restriction endonuclease n=1 Tax=Streptomyces sp. NPDC046759 TaxID=3155019 RepID=UPI0033EEB844